MGNTARPIPVDLVGDQCHDDYQVPDSDAAPAGQIRTVAVTGTVDADLLDDHLRDHHLPGVILDLTHAPLGPKDAALVLEAVTAATERRQRLVVVVPDAAGRAALFDLGMSTMAPLASSARQAREWLEAPEASASRS